MRGLLVLLALCFPFLALCYARPECSSEVCYPTHMSDPMSYPRHGDSSESSSSTEEGETDENGDNGDMDGNEEEEEEEEEYEEEDEGEDEDEDEENGYMVGPEGSMVKAKGLGVAKGVLKAKGLEMEKGELEKGVLKAKGLEKGVLKATGLELEKGVLLEKGLLEKGVLEKGELEKGLEKGVLKAKGIAKRAIKKGETESAVKAEELLQKGELLEGLPTQVRRPGVDAPVPDSPVPLGPLGPLGPVPGPVHPRVAFSVRKAVTPSSRRVRFEDVLTNVGGGWSNRRGQFVAPFRGGYYFSFHAVADDRSDFTLALMRNGVYQVTAYGERDGYQHASNSVFLEMSRGQSVYLELQEGSIYEHPLREAYTTFTGFLLYTY